MTHMLLESNDGETDVDDESGDEGKRKYPEDSWYKRQDVIQGVGHNALENKELGPNTKEAPNPVYTPHDSLL